MYLRAHINRSNVLNLLGKYEEAIQSANDAILISPKHTESHFHKGFALNKLED